MRFGRLTSFAVLSLAMTGCFIFPDAKSPKTGAVVTGEQLAVVDDVKTWTTTSKEKVGETTYTDENGNTVGHATTYADKTETHSMKVWYPFQGNEQLSDEDFFRIAGDQKSLDATLAARETAKKWNKRGKITLVAGAVGFIAGYFVPTGIFQDVLLIGGGLAVSGGWYMAYWGAKQMEPEVHAVDRSIGERDALQYNQNGGHTAGVSMSKSF